MPLAEEPPPHPKVIASKQDIPTNVAVCIFLGTLCIQPRPPGSLVTLDALIPHGGSMGVRMFWGDRLELSNEAGDFSYLPHQEINADPNEKCLAVVVRNEQERWSSISI
jgi:hypothetical protein